MHQKCILSWWYTEYTECNIYFHHILHNARNIVPLNQIVQNAMISQGDFFLPPPQKLQRLEWRNVHVFYNASFNSLYFFNWNLTTRISYHHQPAFPWIFLVAVLDKYSLVFGFQMGQLIILLFDEGWAFEMWTSSALTSLRTTAAFLLLVLRCYTVTPLLIWYVTCNSTWPEEELWRDN